MDDQARTPYRWTRPLPATARVKRQGVKRQAALPRKAGQPRLAFRLNGRARHLIALAREAKSAQRDIGSVVHAYQARKKLDDRISTIAMRIANKPLASRDDLLTLALAGWYAPSAREALLTTILRAGGVKTRVLS